MSTVSAVAEDVALVAATAKTVLELNTAAGDEDVLTEVSVSFDGQTSGAQPVLVELIFANTPGTGTAVTPVKLDRRSSQTISTTAKSNDTVEPTGSVTVAKAWRIHPQSGQLVQYPLGREIWMKQSDVFGVRITAPAAVKATVSLEFEENG